MATRKNVQLPKEWTTAQVRVNPQGKVQVKIAANKVKNPDLNYYAGVLPRHVKEAMRQIRAEKRAAKKKGKR